MCPKDLFLCDREQLDGARYSDLSIYGHSYDSAGPAYLENN